MNEEITRVAFRKWYTGAVLAAVVALVVMLLLLPGVSHALTLEQQPLVGLKGVRVVVGKISPGVERLGLTRTQIQTDIELKLRKAGVRVLTQEEMLETPGLPYLYVTLNTSVGSNLCAYCVGVELKERVTLSSGFETYGAIWDTGGVGTVWTNKTKEIRKDVGDRVDVFINDYLAANPK